VLRVKLTHNHPSAISGITSDGPLFLPVRVQAFDAHGVVGFPRVLLRRIPGEALVICNRSPTYQGQPINNFVARGAAHRLHWVSSASLTSDGYHAMLACT
jgi:hypothetical protein